MKHGQSTAQKTVEAYLAALSRHDLGAAGAFLAEDATMAFAGAEFEMTKPQILTALGWDVGANGRFSYETLTHENTPDNVVVIALTETNEFLDLLDLPPLEAKMTFTVNDASLIQTILYKQTGEGSADPGAIQRALEPAVAWAREDRPEELEEIYPDGQIQYRRETAVRWVRLLREWRESLK